MIYSLAMLIIIITVALDIVKQVRYSNQNKKVQLVINNLVKNQQELYKNFNMLLDVLYEKYANNLTLEVAKYVIELVYGRIATSIGKQVRTYLHDTELYKDGKIEITKIKEDVHTLLKNTYFNEVMILNKMTYKGYSLDDHLINKVEYETIAEEICALISIYSSNNIIRTCEQVDFKIEVYFQTLISKGKTHFENL